MILQTQFPLTRLTSNGGSDIFVNLVVIAVLIRIGIYLIPIDRKNIIIKHTDENLKKD